MTRRLLDPYRRAQDGFDAVLRAVPSARWDPPSACADWTLRDVAGHVIWGQEQLAHWATGQHYGRTEGAPGATTPARWQAPILWRGGAPPEPRPTRPSPRRTFAGR